MSTGNPQSPVAPSNSGLSRFFKIAERGSTPGTEIRAGITTFIVMAYIIFLNPIILSFSGIPGLEGQGPPFAAVVAATCLGAGLLCILMGVWSNYPFAMAPGMGINAVVAFQLIAGMGLPWQEAMGIVFMEGIVITILVFTGFRQAMMTAIPTVLKQAIGVGIGLFILFIGLYDGGLVRVPVEVGQTVTSTPAVPLSLGNLTTLPVLITVIGLAIMALMMAWRVKGALLWGILITTAIASIIHYAFGVEPSVTPGKAALPAAILSLPDFSTIGAGFNFGAFARIGVVTTIVTVFTIMLSDFFDTMGTVIGIGDKAGWVNEKGQMKGIFPVLTVDSIGAAVGGLFGTSSNTTYVESAAGVSEGGRTGLTAVVTGILFLLAIFLAPIAGMVPTEATAGALILVGFYMIGIIRNIDFTEFENGFPALMTIAIMPLTYSITNGIGWGFVIYTFIKIVRGKFNEIHWMMYLASAAFLFYFLYPWLQQLFGI